MNKKGSVLDIIQILIILFAFSVFTIIAYTVYDSWKSGTDGVIDSAVANKTEAYGTTALLRMDNIFTFLLAGLGIATVVGAFMIRTHPVFFIASFLILIITILIAAILANTYTEIATDSKLSTAASQYTVIPYIMNNLPYVITILGLLIIIALYAKLKGIGGQNI